MPCNVMVVLSFNEDQTNWWPSADIFHPGGVAVPLTYLPYSFSLLRFCFIPQSQVMTILVMKNIILVEMTTQKNTTEIYQNWFALDSCPSKWQKFVFNISVQAKRKRTQDFHFIV